MNYSSANAAVPTDAKVVGVGFITLYTLAYMGTWLALLCPVLVTLALKINSLVGTDNAPQSMALVAGVGALLAMFGNPFFGKMSDRTTSKLGMRRPWMVIGFIGGAIGIYIVATATSIMIVLVGWCIAQLMFNCVLAVQVAVLSDHIPPHQRGIVSGILGICLPAALIIGSYLVNLFSPNQVMMFMMPTVVAGVLVLLFAFVLKDKRLDPGNPLPPFSLREFASTFYVNPRKSPDFTWAFVSRFLFIMAYAYLATYQPFYLVAHIHTAEADIPGQIFVGTLLNSGVMIIASLLGGVLSDKLKRRKMFVFVASLIYGLALVVLALASSYENYLIGMMIAGFGFGVYLAVDLALVADVLPNPDDAAKDLGVFNIASALPQSVAPAIAPAILAVGSGSYPFLFAVAGGFSVLGALAILPVRRVK